jgi:hypothetical protein
MIKIIYHIYCNHVTYNIVREQIGHIIFSGLYDICDTIYCFITGDKQYIDEIVHYIDNAGKKFVIQKNIPNDTSYERFTLREIYNLINSEDKILYIHSKGVTKNGCVTTNIIDWRNVMEYFIIKKHKECIEHLNDHDVVGINYHSEPVPHFSGNFWWVTGKYYLSLDVNYLNDPSYNAPEFFLFINNPKFKNLHETNVNHYYSVYPYKTYIE